MEARAEYTFEASNPDELSFTKDDVLKILNKDEDPHWYKAELNGQEGFVPSNYIALAPNPWFYARVSRQEAEEILLHSNNKDGAFLVRKSESNRGEFSISVKFQSCVQHFKVLRTHKGEYHLWDQKFKSINALINYHKTVSVSRTHTVFLEEVTSSQRPKALLVQALFDFGAAEEGELAFSRGDVINVTNDEDHNWWEGNLRGMSGVFPANYVTTYDRA
uniref:GRB2 n=1 Tax=Rhabditophanes sp. KR3021 TaxID=114890 RepID=A0AC35TXK9_9BILA